MQVLAHEENMEAMEALEALEALVESSFTATEE